MNVMGPVQSKWHPKGVMQTVRDPLHLGHVLSKWHQKSVM